MEDMVGAALFCFALSLPSGKLVDGFMLPIVFADGSSFIEETEVIDYRLKLKKKKVNKVKEIKRNVETNVYMHVNKKLTTCFTSCI